MLQTICHLGPGLGRALRGFPGPGHCAARDRVVADSLKTQDLRKARERTAAAHLKAWAEGGKTKHFGTRRSPLAGGRVDGARETSFRRAPPAGPGAHLPLPLPVALARLPSPHSVAPCIAPSTSSRPSGVGPRGGKWARSGHMGPEAQVKRSRGNEPMNPRGAQASPGPNARGPRPPLSAASNVSGLAGSLNTLQLYHFATRRVRGTSRPSRGHRGTPWPTAHGRLTTRAPGLE